MRVGVIGLGWMGRVHLRIYSELRGVEVVGVVDPSEEVRAEVAKTYDVPTHATMEPLLDAGLDAVSVCVPTVMHAEVGRAAMERGVSALIEKPLAATAAEGRMLVDLAKEKGVALMVGHVERFNPAVARIRDIVKDDRIISIQIERVGPYPPRIQDVGVVRDLASHDIDLVHHISGSRYKEIHAVTSCNIGPHEDTVIISAQMENNVLGQMNCNWVTPYKSRQIHVATPKRYIEGNLITQQVKEYSQFETYDKSYSVREWPLIFREPVREELNAFLDALRSGSTPPITGEDGLYVLETIEAISNAGCKVA